MTDHRCRAADACVAKTSDGPAMTVGPNTVCQRCITRLQDQFDQLPQIRSVLRLFLPKGLVPQGGGTPVTSTPTPSVPLSVGVLDLIDEIDDVLLHGRRIVDLIRQGPETVWTSGRQRYLDGVDRALAVGRVWKKSDGVIGISRIWNRHLAKCPDCEERSLGSFSGSDSVQCEGCGAILDRNSYEKLCLIEANQKRK